MAGLIRRAVPLNLLAFLLVLSVGSSTDARAAITCDPFARFAPRSFHDPTTIDNPYLPMIPGTRLSLAGTANVGGGVERHRVTFTVTDVTKVINGVRTLVVWDVDRSSGQVVESEIAFFAQDDAGNVWNLGEYPEEFEDGTFVGAPSTWIAGLRGAKAGVHMAGRPRVSESFYVQGSAPDIEFLDCARVTATRWTVTVPAGTFRNAVVTEETSPLDPEGGSQIKRHARGVGIVKVTAVNDPEGETLRLRSRKQLTPAGLAAARRQVLALDARAYENSEVYRRTPRAQPPHPRGAA